MSSLPVIDAVTNPELGLTAKEQVAEVDENDNVIRPISRAEMRAQKLRHRATYIFAKNSKDEFFRVPLFFRMTRHFAKSIYFRTCILHDWVVPKNDQNIFIS